MSYSCLATTIASTGLNCRTISGHMNMSLDKILRQATQLKLLDSRILSDDKQIRKVDVVPEYGYPRYENESGRSLYLVLDHPTQQFFTSLLVEGAVHQCPVLYDKITGHFLSLSVKGPEEELGSLKGDVAEADMFTLAGVFGIMDRATHTKQNYAISGGVAYHHDLVANFLYLINLAKGERDSIAIEERFNGMSDIQKSLVKQKLLHLRGRFGGPKGKAFMRSLYRFAQECGKDSKSHPSNDYNDPSASGDTRYGMYLQYYGVKFNIEFHEHSIDEVHDALLRRLNYLLTL